MQLARFPRIRFAHLPTPLEPLPRLAGALGGPHLFVKRDDCTGLAFGGNKARKLEFLVADAVAGGADTLITAGGVQSNHVRQTAAAAARLGLACELVLTPNVPRTDDDYSGGGNIQLDRLLGAGIHILSAGDNREQAMIGLAERLRAHGRRPYVIPVGGSNAIGALGYVAAAAELERQAEERDLVVDHVVVATSSGGTQAGFLAGFHGLRSRFSGHAGPPHAEVTAVAVRRHVAEALAHLGHGNDGAPEVEVVAGHAGDGYGLPSAAMVEAVRRLARLEGLILDPVYAGKAMAGLIALVTAGRFAPSETVVFLHTGGQPALFAYRAAFADGG